MGSKHLIQVNIFGRDCWEETRKLGKMNRWLPMAVDSCVALSVGLNVSFVLYRKLADTYDGLSGTT
jgi:hypothetical protein